MLKREFLISEPDRPRWCRLATVRRVYGITEQRIYELLNSGVLETAVVKDKGKKRGIRWISVKSLERYFKALTTTKVEPMTKFYEHRMKKPKKEVVEA